MAKILLVESEPNLASAISNWLTDAKHSVRAVKDESQGLNELKVARGEYDLVILDLVDQEARCVDICKMYRELAAKTSIVLLGTESNLPDHDGPGRADAYVRKPVQLNDFNDKIKTLLHGPVSTDEVEIRLRNLVVDVNAKKVFKGGVPVHLAPKEYALFEFLLNNRDQIFSHEELLLRLWGLNEVKSDDTVRGHIKRLRRKLDEPGARSIIASLYGFGYKLESDEQVAPGNVKVSSTLEHSNGSEQSQRMTVVTEHSFQA
ncbi:MAG: response regulator transcription factor [Candidatus Obscuribacterales bacterium]|nr:response regulator transcription factor [Candidatus Obscuribacterales bacterium]